MKFFRCWNNLTAGHPKVVWKKSKSWQRSRMIFWSSMGKFWSSWPRIIMVVTLLTLPKNPFGNLSNQTGAKSLWKFFPLQVRLDFESKQILILRFQGQPSPALWRHYENWWGGAKVQWLDQVSPRKDDVPDWHMRAMWLSKQFMATYWRMMSMFTLNMSTMNVEYLIWHLTMLRNVLLELYLVKPADLEAGMKATIFQKIGQAGKVRK